MHYDVPALSFNTSLFSARCIRPQLSIQALGFTGALLPLCSIYFPLTLIQQNSYI